jgi:hypothetical protein
MTTKLLAPAPSTPIQTSGALYTADQNGVIGAAPSGDVIDLIRAGCTLLPAYNNPGATTDPNMSNESGAIVIALTGSSYTTGAANDVVATWFEVNATN